MLIYNIFFLVLVLGKLKSFSINSKFCGIDLVGRCISPTICPQKNVLYKGSCENELVCCQVSEKIVTPDNNVNSAPQAPGGAPPSAGSPGSSTPPGGGSAPPSGSSPPSSSVPPTSGSTPGGAPPSTGAPQAPGGGTQSGGSTPGSSAPPSGSTPPAGQGGSSPPSGGTPPSGSQPPGGQGGSPPSGGTPPNGSTPPGGGSPPSGGSPPPLMGNIMVPPNIPNRFNPPTTTPSDTIVISAEIIDNSLDFLEKKCTAYNSMIPAKQMSTPVVMVIGGVDTLEKEFPHMAALGFGDVNAKQWLCGGSLVSDRYVITAAHCLSVSSVGDVRYVKLGNIDLNTNSPNTQEFNVISRLAHPEYHTSGQYNDIALIQMDGSARITSFVLPICLFSSSDYGDRNLIATGWGKTDTGASSQRLQKVGLEFFTQQECQDVYKVIPRDQLPLGIQESTQICAGSRSQKKDTCQGDSGGPLQFRKDNRWYLVGITSFGIQCGSPNVPGVYTRLSYYVTWIQQTIWNK